MDGPANDGQTLVQRVEWKETLGRFSQHAFFAKSYPHLLHLKAMMNVLTNQPPVELLVDGIAPAIFPDLQFPPKIILEGTPIYGYIYPYS